MYAPEEVARRWFSEVWNDRNQKLVMDLMAPGASGHMEGGLEITGPEEFIAFQDALLKTLPDIRLEILHSLSGGDLACVMWRASAREDTVRFCGTTWFKVQDGKVVEGWDCWNQGELMSKLAVL